MRKSILHIVIPVYNEDNNILHIIKHIKHYAHYYGIVYHVYFVDDNSISGMTKKNLKRVSTLSDVTVLKNPKKGQQYAILKGFYHVFESGFADDYVCTLDCDMQDPVDVLFRMYISLLGHRDEYSAVIGVRNYRQDNIMKKITADIYYKVQTSILHTYIPNASNFYIMKVRDVKILHPDNLSGSLIIKNKTMYYKYNRVDRKSGCTKYGFFKLCRLAFLGLRWSIMYRKSKCRNVYEIRILNRKTKN